jgi:uncharacterized protein (TIGR02118 family)
MKYLTLITLILITGSVIAQNSNNELKMKEGSIKVSVLYPNSEEITFDMDYYKNNHLPMAGELLGKAVIGLTLEKGLGGGAPDSKPTYFVMTNLYFESVESFQNAFGPNAEKIMGDIPNFTNSEPVIQISKVLL